MSKHKKKKKSNNQVDCRTSYINLIVAILQLISTIIGFILMKMNN